MSLVGFARVVVLSAVATTSTVAHATEESEVAEAEAPTRPEGNALRLLKSPVLSVDSQFFIGWAPKAVVLRLALNYRHTYVYNPENNLWGKLTDRTYIQGGIMADLSPAFGRYAVYAEWLPLQVLKLRFDWGLYVHHGYVGLLTYNSENVDWSERARFAADHERAALSHTFRLTTELRLKVWRFVLLSIAETNYMDTAVPEPFVFELWYGMLTARQDWIVINRALLLFELITGPEQVFRLGVYHSVQHAFATDVTNMRAGVAIHWEPARSWWVLERPFIIVFAGMHILDRYFDRPTLLAGAGASFDIMRDE